MAIQYPPLPGHVLICDYGSGFRPPEMVKRRPALVVSPRLRHREGLVTVVPLSTTPPRRETPWQRRINLPFAPPAPFAAVEVWVKADMLATVALARLDLFRSPRDEDARRRYFTIRIADEELEGVRACLVHALGLGRSLDPKDP